MLDDRSETVTIQGSEYTFCEPSRRQSRRLMAGIIRITPQLARVRSAILDSGLDKADSHEEIAAKAATLTGDDAAAMLEIYEPLCDFLVEAIPKITEDVIENATEVELIKAFMSVKGVVERPFVNSKNVSLPTVPRHSTRTPHSSTRKSNTTATPTGKQEHTS